VRGGVLNDGQRYVSVCGESLRVRLLLALSSKIAKDPRSPTPEIHASKRKQCKGATRRRGLRPASARNRRRTRSGSVRSRRGAAKQGGAGLEELPALWHKRSWSGQETFPALGQSRIAHALFSACSPVVRYYPHNMYMDRLNQFPCKEPSSPLRAFEVGMLGGLQLGRMHWSHDPYRASAFPV
jgi:hypothetical protein